MGLWDFRNLDSGKCGVCSVGRFRRGGRGGGGRRGPFLFLFLFLWVWFWFLFWDGFVRREREKKREMEGL